MATQLFYDGDTDYPVELNDEIEVIAAEHRFPAVIKAVHPKIGKVTVSFEGIDPVLDLILLRKSARIPFSAVELVRRGW